MCDNVLHQRYDGITSLLRQHPSSRPLYLAEAVQGLRRGVVDDDNMAWRAPAIAGATSAALTTTAALAGDRVQTMNSSTITDVQGLQHHNAHVGQLQNEVEAEAADLQGLQHHDAHVGQLQNEVEAEAADLQVPADANRPTQPIEAPAAAEYKAGDDQGELLESAMPEPAAGDSRKLQPEHPSTFEEAVALEQEESMAWGSFCSADPEGEGALRDGEDEYHVVGPTGAPGEYI
ncbi:g5806 [Coccomyxa elongata]